MADEQGQGADGQRVATSTGEALARARVCFLVDEPVADGVVRPPIIASWRRSRERRVSADRLEVPLVADVPADTLLRHAADPVIRDAASQLAGEPVSLILCDAHGTVVQQHTGDAGLAASLDRVSLAPGFSYAEEHVGTNGIGTALAARGPVHVFGHEHFAEHLDQLACAGAPVRHPVTGRVLGLVDLTCWRRDAGVALVSAATAIARRVEDALLSECGQREHALLNDYLQACRRGPGAVVAIGPDLLIMNDEARSLLGATGRSQLVAEALDALAAGLPHLLLDLPDGTCARVTCKPSGNATRGREGVLHIQAVTDPEKRARGRAAAAAAQTGPLGTTVVGSSVTWRKCTLAVERNFRAHEWLVLQGEAGTGKTALVRAVHLAHTPAAHLRVFDATDFGPRWTAEIIDELESGGGSIVLTHIHMLAPDAVEQLTDVLHPHRESTHPDRPWVVATMAPTEGPATDQLEPLVSCFPRTVMVPPLRHHAADLADLVPHLLARLVHGDPPTCSEQAMSVLMRNRWQGNVEELRAVLRKVAARKRSGVITPEDLPPECRRTTRRVLSPIEAMACDAIVDALAKTDGDKAHAAKILGMSRATIYRKIHQFGLVHW